MDFHLAIYQKPDLSFGEASWEEKLLVENSVASTGDLLMISTHLVPKWGVIGCEIRSRVTVSTAANNRLLHVAQRNFVVRFDQFVRAKLLVLPKPNLGDR